MTKSWEETWTAQPMVPQTGWSSGGTAVSDAPGTLVVDVFANSEMDIPRDAQDVAGKTEARTRLIAAAPDMARALIEVEWVLLPDDRYGPRCPCCLGLEWKEGEPRTGHEDWCKLSAALRKAGVR